VLLLPGLVGCWSGFAQENSYAAPPQPQYQADGSPRTLRGTVVNSVTGEPIYRALVQIGGQYAALTDHEGHFEFPGASVVGIPPWAMKPGYFSENGSQGFIPNSPANNALIPGDQPLVVKLVPEAIITGTVTGQDGAPLEGIRVQVRTLRVQDGLARWRNHGGTVTDSEGQFRFSGLEAGEYAVSTGFHTEGLADTQGATAYVPVRYPPYGGGASAETAITLRAGDHVQANLAPDVARLYPVTGSVSGYGESRGVSFRVQTAAGAEISPASRFFFHTGEFRLLLPAGAYRITATTYVRQISLEARREVTVPQGPVSGVAFALEPFAAIPVEIEAQSANQQSDANKQSDGTDPQPPSAQFFLFNSDPTAPYQPQFAHPPQQGTSFSIPDGVGSRLIDNLAPGHYLLGGQAQPPWYVASASCGGVDLTRDELAIAGSAAGCSIRIVLRNDSGSVHVTLKNSDAILNQGPVVVYLLPVGDFVRASQQLPMNRPETTLNSIAPGRYFAIAMDHREELPYRDPEAMRRYSGRGEEIVVPLNGRADVELSLGTEER
jgi:hypothetical protein